MVCGYYPDFGSIWTPARGPPLPCTLPTCMHLSADDVRVALDLIHAGIPRHAHHLLRRQRREITM
jgi:hypothetical protein